MGMPTDISVSDLKAWARMHFEERLRGERLTAQFERWASGELGQDYMFQIDMRLNDAVAAFIRDPANRAKLDAARGRDT